MHYRTIFSALLASVALTAHAQSIDLPPAPILLRGEVDAAPFLIGMGERLASGRIVSTADRSVAERASKRSMFQLMDELYITAPAGRSLGVGDLLLSLARGPKVHGVGRVIVPSGILQVLRVDRDGLYRVRIAKQFGEITLDQQTVMYEGTGQSPTGLQPTTPDSSAAGAIVAIHGRNVLPSALHYVFVQMPERVALRPGDEVMLVDNQRRRDTHRAMPPEIVGRARIVKVTPVAATAIILDVAQPAIRRGTWVMRVAEAR
jgi:hypothetical protein